MVKLVLNPNKFKTLGLAVHFFKRSLKYYIINYCKENQTKIREIDKYLKEELGCSASSLQILLYAWRHLYYEKGALSLKRDLKMGDYRVNDLIRLLEYGNLDIVGLHVLKKGTAFANSQI